MKQKENAMEQNVESIGSNRVENISPLRIFYIITGVDAILMREEFVILTELKRGEKNTRKPTSCYT